ncbi:neuroglobin-1-like [Ruditapes philippinarum]|uniref:neuroglobin-1-like n=1 Tax=Ruditapes philippinarum TaxID=129788 RepID=UPI00295B9AA3|nr:neuroglobin-1-like [Ruditapes philippinarum]
MGCTQSVTYAKDTYDRDPNSSLRAKRVKRFKNPQPDLTEHEIQIIKSTWHYMTHDLAGNGLQIFLKIFELCPDTKSIFHVENVRHSELAKHKVIRAHGVRFMNAISAAIYCLRENIEEKDKIDAFLINLGQKHKQASEFKAEYFEIFHEALMWRWRICIGKGFTQEVSDTWNRVFVYMLEKINQGYHLQ